MAEILDLIFLNCGLMVSLFVSMCQYSLEFKLHPEEIERWFTKIDHIFEHTRIPQIGEVLTPFYKISVDKGQRHHLPIVSHINYKLSSSVILSASSFWNVSLPLFLFNNFLLFHRRL